MSGLVGCKKAHNYNNRIHKSENLEPLSIFHCRAYFFIFFWLFLTLRDRFLLVPICNILSIGLLIIPVELFFLPLVQTGRGYMRHLLNNRTFLPRFFLSYFEIKQFKFSLYWFYRFYLALFSFYEKGSSPLFIPPDCFHLKGGEFETKREMGTIALLPWVCICLSVLIICRLFGFSFGFHCISGFAKS